MSSNLPMLAQQRQQHLVAVIDQAAPKLREIAPPNVDMDKFVRLAKGYIYQHQELLEAEPASLSVALMECATLGLYPSAVLNEAFLFVIKGKVKFLPQWQGILKLARRGEIKNLRPYLVYRQDRFEIEYGLAEKLVHIPNFDHDFKDDDITGCYVVKDYKDGTQAFTYMPIKRVLRIRDQHSRDYQSRGGNSTWALNFPGMVIKTVIKAALKTESLSDDLARLISRDDAVERGEEPPAETIALPKDYLTGRTEAPDSSAAPSDVEPQPAEPVIEVKVDPEPIKVAKPKGRPAAKPPEPPKSKEQPKAAYFATDEDCPI